MMIKKERRHCIRLTLRKKPNLFTTPILLASCFAALTRQKFETWPKQHSEK